MACETTDILAKDQRVSLPDSLLLYHVPLTPAFLEKVAILKPSGMTIQCYLYIIGKGNFQTENTSYVDGLLVFQHPEVVKLLARLSLVVCIFGRLPRNIW